MAPMEIENTSDIEIRLGRDEWAAIKEFSRLGDSSSALSEDWNFFTHLSVMLRRKDMLLLTANGLYFQRGFKRTRSSTMGTCATTALS